MTFSPYFQQFSKQKRICPQCHNQTHLEEGEVKNPNAAIERCECGYQQVHLAPKAAQIVWDDDHPWDGHVPSEYMPEFHTDTKKTVFINFDSAKKKDK